MKIERITPALGAEIDIDLGNITAGGAQAVYDALMAHQVVFFPGSADDAGAAHRAGQALW